MPRAKTEVETLESGKAIMRLYDDESGQLLNEEHSYGMADIAITLVFQGGKKIAERYVHKRRQVKRKKYEEVRLSYPDMPAADPSIRDAGAELLQMEAEEKRQAASDRRRHVPDPAKARQSDEFCMRMLDAARHAPAQTWLDDGHERSLGELTPEQSRKLIAKLQRLGAQAIHVCQLKTHPDGSENSEDLVVELPHASAHRKSLLKELDRLAREYGYDGDPDDGQRYTYVKLG